MRVLVVGGSGFIGAHVVERCLQAGHEVGVFDLSHYRGAGATAVESIVGDLRDEDALAAAMSGRDQVLHFAAVADVSDVLADPALAESVNAEGTFHVLQAARRSGVRRVVYASTIWVYGTREGTEEIDEDAELALPDHFYTATKLAGEMYCRSYGMLYDLEYTILRLGIPYGPGARPAAVVPTFVGLALAGKPLTIGGDGLQSRRFVYVEDLAAGVVSALGPVAANRVYNLVGSETVTIREAAAIVQRQVADVPIVTVPGRVGDIRGAEISGERAARELGWRASTPFAEGVRRYTEWLLSQGGNGSVVNATANGG